MSSWFSLYAGIEIPVRMGSGRKHWEKENENESPQRSTCGPFTWAFAHAQSPFVYVKFVTYVLPAYAAPSCWFMRWSVRKRKWYSPAGRRGGFFKDRVLRSGRGDGMTAMSRQNPVCSGPLQVLTNVMQKNTRAKINMMICFNLKSKCCFCFLCGVSSYVSAQIICHGIIWQHLSQSLHMYLKMWRKNLGKDFP